MAKTVLVTPEAAEGIAARAGVDLLVESEVELLQKQASYLLANDGVDTGQAARCCVLRNYGWMKNLQHFNELLEPGKFATGEDSLSSAKLAEVVAP